MSSLNLKRNHLTFLLGALLAFLIVAAPQTAKADICDPTGDYYTTQAQTLTNMAQRKVGIHKDYLDNAVSLDTQMYCLDQLISGIETIRGLTASVDFWHAIAFLAIKFILDPLIMFACQAAAQAIAAINSYKGMLVQICLPLPKLHLGLTIPHPQAPCLGTGTPIGAVGLMATPNATATQNNWNSIWQGANGKFQVYMPKGQ